MNPLEQRVAALEQQLAELQGGEPLTPNYLTVHPDGTTSASFSGHVSAQGVDLTEATSSTPPASDVLRWLRANGATDPVGNPPVQVAGYVDADNKDTLSLEANTVSPSAGAKVMVSAQNFTGGGASVQATLLDDTGHSDYLRGKATSFGPVTIAAGATITIPHGLPYPPKTAFAVAVGWMGFLESGTPDATNVYFAPSIALAGNFLFWLATA